MENIDIFSGGYFRNLEIDSIKKALMELISLYMWRIENLNIVLMSDEELRKINIDYLDHDYYTDVITFDLSDDNKVLEGEIYISEDRIIENAENQGVEPLNELRRVIIHGILHLLGFNDKTEKELQKMRSMENQLLTQLFHVEQ